MSGTPNWKRTLAEIEAVASPGGRARLGSCSIEGTRLFERALRAGVELPAALASAAFLDDDRERPTQLRAELERKACRLERVGDEVMERLTAGRSLGGIVGLAKLPRAPSLEELLAAPVEEPVLLLVGAELNDPGNVGALCRTAHASGARALLTAGASDAFHPKAVRTSMGSVLRLPVLAWKELDALLAELSAAGVRTLGAVTTGGTPLPRLASSAQPTALVVGSEAFGLGEEARAQVDEEVSIPMAEGVDSLSVNAAAAVLLYELRRSRLIRPPERPSGS